jgi:hypothetical protein
MPSRTHRVWCVEQLTVSGGPRNREDACKVLQGLEDTGWAIFSITHDKEGCIIHVVASKLVPKGVG